MRIDYSSQYEQPNGELPPPTTPGLGPHTTPGAKPFDTPGAHAAYLDEAPVVRPVGSGGDVI